MYSLATDQRGGLWNAVKAVLRLMSWGYGIGLRFVLLLYRMGLLRKYKCGRPVISVGNITMGGVGKTPLVVWVVQALKEKGLRSAVVTRGYMGEGHRAKNRESDEARMLERLLRDVPVLVGPDRVRNIKDFLTQSDADVFVLDDGFQHWRLARDLDIVALDATNPWGNGALIPRGTLREPRTALSRADVIVLTKTDLGGDNVERIKARLRRMRVEKIVVEAVHSPVALTGLRFGESQPLSLVQGRDVCLFCSLGDPRSFERTLKNLGARVKRVFEFPDHHSYTADDIRTINAYCSSEGVKALVTTEKDSVKLTSFLGLFGDTITLLSLRIEIKITQGRDAFLQRITHLS